MAYNLLKGTVEGSVDQHADQEIEGVKVFKNVVSASIFYDTEAQSPCATESNVALRHLKSPTKNGVIIYDADKKARTSRNLKLEGNVLLAQHAIITKLTGSGGGLTNLQAEHIVGQLGASSIQYDRGIEAYREHLRVKVGPGLKVDEEGVSLNLRPNGALNADTNQLTINIKDSLSVTEKGQNLSDQDLLLVHDANRNEARHTTTKNFYDKYLSSKVPHPGGSPHSVQYRQGKEFAGSADLTFEPQSATLSVGKAISVPRLKTAHRLYSNGELHVNGALYKNISLVTQKQYQFKETDHTVLLDPSENKIIAILPAAKDNEGRVITIKRICGGPEKYKIVSAYPVVIRTEGEFIDFSHEVILKSNYSVRTFHSDGTKWWVTNRTGS